MLGVILREIILEKPREYWLEKLEKVGVPCGPINNLQQIFDDPHVIARETQREVKHPVAGSLPSVANPIRMSDVELSYDKAPPTLGQHNVEVLKGLLEFNDDDIERFRRAGVI